MLLALVAALAHAACPDLTDEKKAWNAKALEALVEASRSGDPAEPIVRVKKLRDANDLCSPRDRYHAAVVLLLGDPDDVSSAFTLATQSLAGGVKEAGAIAAQAKDKELVEQGKEQAFGTLLGERDGRACVFPINAGVTDSARAKFGLPPLKERLAELAARADMELGEVLQRLIRMELNGQIHRLPDSRYALR